MVDRVPCVVTRVSIIVTFYDKLVVLEAFILTAAVFVGLTVYTLQSKKDYSTWGAWYVRYLSNIEVSICATTTQRIVCAYSLFSFLWILIMGGLFQVFL